MKRTLIITLLLLMSGCVSKQIKPALDANAKNMGDLTKHTQQTVILLESVSRALWQDEIEYRRTIVLDRLNILRGYLSRPTTGKAFTGKEIQDSVIAGGALAGQYQVVATAMSAAHEPSDRIQIQTQYPVLSAYVLAKIKPETIADDINKLIETAGQLEVIKRPIRNKIADHYPYVKKAHDGQKETSDKLRRYQEILEKETKLAILHADLFVYAMEYDVKVEQVFASILGLEQEILGLIDDGTSKEIAGEAFTSLRTLLDMKVSEDTESTSP